MRQQFKDENSFDEGQKSLKIKTNERNIMRASVFRPRKIGLSSTNPPVLPLSRRQPLTSHKTPVTSHRQLRNETKWSGAVSGAARQGRSSDGNLLLKKRRRKSQSAVLPRNRVETDSVTDHRAAAPETTSKQNASLQRDTVTSRDVSKRVSVTSLTRSKTAVPTLPSGDVRSQRRSVVAREVTLTQELCDTIARKLKVYE